MIDSPDGAPQPFSYSVQLLSLSLLSAVSEHRPPHGYKFIYMLHTCGGMKSKCDKICMGVKSVHRHLSETSPMNAGTLWQYL